MELGAGGEEGEGGGGVEEEGEGEVVWGEGRGAVNASRDGAGEEGVGFGEAADARLRGGTGGEGFRSHIKPLMSVIEGNTLKWSQRQARIGNAVIKPYHPENHGADQGLREIPALDVDFDHRAHWAAVRDRDGELRWVSESCLSLLH
ncbi:uncharacterized protein A4U43_C10F13120 [Asparagus officinalis]|uniref:Uncharacterized protein n=1 Tax=Asparagus officinalis TaxID=4686 RepID=A0A5P1E2N7_ASPOF|nr:uncharacterized protein A4U43_C10F13120 [Asparagus officinalis]